MMAIYANMVTKELPHAECCVHAAAGKGRLLQLGLACAPADLALIEDACHNGALCHCNQTPAQHHAPCKSFISLHHVYPLIEAFNVADPGTACLHGVFMLSRGMVGVQMQTHTG